MQEKIIILDFGSQTTQLIGRRLRELSIGLTLCKQIISLHGGQISVQSTAGKGSRFRLSFPAV